MDFRENHPYSSLYLSRSYRSWEPNDTIYLPADRLSDSPFAGSEYRFSWKMVAMFIGIGLMHSWRHAVRSFSCLLAVMVQACSTAPCPTTSTKTSAAEVAPVEPRSDPYAIYVAKQKGDGADPSFWDERIAAAIAKALNQGRATRVVFPPHGIKIRQTVRVWRVRKSSDTDTTGDAITEWSDQRQLFHHINGSQAQLARRLILEGTSQSARLNWQGGENGVMIDVPSPWQVQIRNLWLDGNDVPGTIGIRLRPGWEFQANTGRQTRVDSIYFERLDIGVWIGDPFQPDLVNYQIENNWISGVRIGMLFEGANVTGMHVRDNLIFQYDEAALQLVGYGGRQVRTPAQIAAYPSPTPEERNKFVFDALGNEYSTQDLLNTRNSAGQSLLIAQKARAMGGGPWSQQADSPAVIGGGGPVVEVQGLTGASHNPVAWTFRVFEGRLAAQDVRIEGAAGFLFRDGIAQSPNGRFADVFRNCNHSHNANTSGDIVHYDAIGPVYFYDSYFNGRLAFRDKADVYDGGTRFGPGTCAGPSICMTEGEVLVSQESSFPANGWAISGPSASLKRRGHQGSISATPVRYTGSHAPGFVAISGSITLHKLFD